MATIKSYTDINQSKKLAEILPLESADMCYIKHSSSDNPNWEFNEDFPPMILGNVPINEITAETLPCWSLAALLRLIPDFDMHKRTIECRIETTNHFIVKVCDLVDAAFEMVCWLKKEEYI